VPLLETYLRADPPCLMYEFIEGGDLAGLIQETHERALLTPAFATQVVQRLASTVAFAHQHGLVHRDLKPAKILVRRSEANDFSLHIADFGIGGLTARHSLQGQAGRPTTPSQAMPTAARGAYTPLYASPQQIRGERADPRDDVHVLGVLWYQLLTGDLGLLSIPSDWRDVIEERGLGAEGVRLLASCLASRAEKRPAHAGELVDRLGAGAEAARGGNGNSACGGVTFGVRYVRRHRKFPTSGPGGLPSREAARATVRGHRDISITLRISLSAETVAGGRAAPRSSG
jgi:serine/threonine protein kinase